MSSDGYDDYDIDNINKKKLRNKRKRDVKLNYDSDSSEDHGIEINELNIIPTVLDKDHVADGIDIDDDNNKIEDSVDDMFASEIEETDSKDEDTSANNVKKNSRTDQSMYSKNKQNSNNSDTPRKEEHIWDFDSDIIISHEQSLLQEEEISDEAKQTQMDYQNQIEILDDATRLKMAKDKGQVKIEAFNLEEEDEEGNFDLDGNYIRNEKPLDENNTQDQWMDQIKGFEIAKAKVAHEKRERLQKEKRQSSRSSSTASLLRKLIEILEPAETPMEALARFKPQKGSKNNSKKFAKSPDHEKENIRKKTVFELTAYCDELINDKGLSEIYDLSREELMRNFKNETGLDFEQEKKGKKRSLSEAEIDNEITQEQETSEDHTSQYYEDKIWEYKWVDEENVNGPFTSYEMDYWAKNYFQGNVFVRRHGQNPFRHIDEVLFNEV